jgi:hypothetical protein
MIPLVWIFFAWLVVVGIFVLASLLTLATALRYGLSCTWTYLIAGLFIAVSAAVLLMTLGYAASSDLSRALDPLSLF